MTPAIKQTAIAVVGLALVGVSVGEWVAHRRVERDYRKAIDTRQRLELELGEIRADRDRLSGVLTEEQQRVQQLASTLSTKEAEWQAVVERLAQEERIILELQGRLLAMQHQFDRLQGELAMALDSRTGKAAASGAAVMQLEKVVVSRAGAFDSAAAFAGRVISFNPQWRFVVMDLGWDAVNIGDVVSIHRDEQVLGKARVERVQEAVSAASLLPESVQAEIQVNDLVRVL